MSAIAYFGTGRGHWAEADRDFGKALAIDPTNPDTLHLSSLLLILEGWLKQALAVRVLAR